MNFVVPEGLERFATKRWSEDDEEGYREWMESYSKIFADVVEHCMGWYNNMIRDGVSKELAEQILPRCVKV